MRSALSASLERSRRAPSTTSWASAATEPLSRRDPDGRIRLHGIPVLQPIDDGDPRQPGRGIYMALGTTPGGFRSILVEQTWSHEQFSDVLGNLQHSRILSVLNNRNDFGGLRTGSNVFRVYDDSLSGGWSLFLAGVCRVTPESDSLRPTPARRRSWQPEQLPRYAHRWRLDVFQLRQCGGICRSRETSSTSACWRTICSTVASITGVSLRVVPGLEVMNVPADVSLMRVIVTNITPSLPLKVCIRRTSCPTSWIQRTTTRAPTSCLRAAN